MPALVIAAAFGLANALRFQLIEPSDWGPICNAIAQTKESSIACSAREMTIAFFSFNRLAWLALGASLIALVIKNPWLALCALSLASLGLVLYSALWCAPAFWLALLAYQKAQSSRKKPDTA